MRLLDFLLKIQVSHALVNPYLNASVRFSKAPQSYALVPSSTPISQIQKSTISSASNDSLDPFSFRPFKEYHNNAIVATSVLTLIDCYLRSVFSTHAIPFPSSLAGCGGLFFIMILLDWLSLGRSDQKWGESIYQFLNPGANLLAKWLPVFFVPSLITLPLASGIGNSWEMLKVFSVIVGGFLFTLFSTSSSVLAMRKMMRLDNMKYNRYDPIEITTTSIPQTVTSSKPFSLKLFRNLISVSLMSALCTIILIKQYPASKWIKPLQSCFLLFATLSSFVFGSNLPKSFTSLVHPLVTCTCLSWLAAKNFASLAGCHFLSIIRSFKSGSLAFFFAGAGDILLFLLGPAVVALACQMYARKNLMRKNIREVCVSTIVSSIGGLYGTAAIVRLLGIELHTFGLSLLSRNITSPLAMAIASIIGADVSLAVTVVVLTGLFGANFGASILNAVGIKDPVARGLGIGAAAHGLGTAAFAKEEDAFPFAAIAMALTASASTILVSIPLVRQSLLKLCGISN